MTTVAGDDRAGSALAVRHISATYAENGVVLQALADVTFDVQPGEFVALIGPSGSGKSTLLDIVAGLLDPDDGEILLDGESLPAARRLGRSAFMHQRDLLLPWRRAVDNAAISLQIQGEPRHMARAKAADWFEQFGLSGFEHSYPAQLSGGMRQRVAFVRTMLGGQRLILLDEPFGSLDSLTRTAARDWLAGALAVDRRSVLLVTHDVDEAIYLADRILVFSPRPGRVVHVEVVSEPRPRNAEFQLSEEFAAHRARLLTWLGIVHPGSGGR